jgi:hypothetical protein
MPRRLYQLAWRWSVKTIKLGLNPNQANLIEVADGAASSSTYEPISSVWEGSDADLLEAMFKFLRDDSARTNPGFDLQRRAILEGFSEARRVHGHRSAT